MTSKKEQEEAYELAKKRHLFMMNDDLGKAYEKNYQFDVAMKHFKTSNELMPCWGHTYITIAEIYRKMNNLDKSIETKQMAQKTKYYSLSVEYKDASTDELFNLSDEKRNEITSCISFHPVIDSYLKEYIEKKAKGYIYKLRKRKQEVQ